MDPQTQPTQPKKSNRRWWLIILILLLIGGAAAAYFVTKDDNETASTTPPPASQNTTTPTNSFAPSSTADTPYVATVNTTSAGKTTKATMTSDGQGNVSYVYNTGGQSASLIYTSDAYYLCMGTSTCIKYPKAQSSSSGFDPATYNYDSSKIANLKNTAAYKGQQACPSPASGNCDVWSVSYGGVTSTMYIETTTKRIVKVTTASGTTSSEVTYEYKNATVTVPTKFTTLSNNH